VLHRACAEALLAHDEHALAAEHLEAAGDVEAACERLVVASDALLSMGRHGEASAVLARWRRLCEAQGTVDGPARVPGWLQVAALARRQRDQDTLEEAVAHIDASTGPDQGSAWRGAVAMARADLAHQRGDLEGFEAAVREARSAFREVGDAVGEVRAIYRLGALARQRGRLEQALALLQEARERAQSMQPPPPVRWSAEILLGTTHVELGDLDAAGAAYAAAARAARDRGDLSHLSDALNGLGEVARERGDAEEAARWYAEAIEVRQAVGQRTVVARLNLALLYFQQGLFDDGDRHARLAVREARESEKPLLAAASALRLIALSTAEDAVWDRAAMRSEELLRDSRYLDPDVFTALDLAATRAHADGRQDRAQWCARLASALRQLG
jgi:tetratricopeptide (TPR) repeat protein